MKMKRDQINLGLVALIASQCGVLVYASSPQPLPLAGKVLMEMFFAAAAIAGVAWVVE